MSFLPSLLTRSHGLAYFELGTSHGELLGRIPGHLPHAVCCDLYYVTLTHHECFLIYAVKITILIHIAAIWIKWNNAHKTQLLLHKKYMYFNFFYTGNKTQYPELDQKKKTESKWSDTNSSTSLLRATLDAQRWFIGAITGPRERASGEEYWWVGAKRWVGGFLSFGELCVQKQSQLLHCCGFYLLNVGWDDRLWASCVVFYQSTDTLPYHLHCISHVVMFFCCII